MTSGNSRISMRAEGRRGLVGRELDNEFTKQQHEVVKMSVLHTKEKSNGRGRRITNPEIALYDPTG